MPTSSRPQVYPPESAQPRVDLGLLQRTWPPDLLVLLWGELFADGAKDTKRDIALVSVVSLADAGLITLHRNPGRFRPVRLVATAVVTEGVVDEIKPPEWACAKTLVKVWTRPDRGCTRLQNVGRSTGSTAGAQGLAVRGGRRFWRWTGTPEVLASSEGPARELAESLRVFRQANPALARQLASELTISSGG